MPRIVESRPATAEEWQAHHIASASATFFEGPEWADVWRRYTAGRIRPAPRLISFDDGVRVVAPWSIERRAWGRDRVLAAPAGAYGSWLYRSDTPIGAPHVAALFRQLRRRPAVLRQNPFDPVLAAVEPAGGWSRGDFTQVLRLDRFEEVERALRQNQVYRKQRQGDAAGLSLRRASKASEVARYYEIYLAAQERWGEEATNRYGRALFDAFDLASGTVDFWLVERAGDIIGGGPFLRAGSRHVVSWLLLADADHFRARPYDFAYAHLIHHYRDQGFRYFDFNPSGGHDGVVRFKENFGATRLPSNLFLRRSLTTRATAALNRALRRRAGTRGG